MGQDRLSDLALLSIQQKIHHSSVDDFLHCTWSRECLILWFCCATELGFSEDIGVKEVFFIIIIKMVEQINFDQVIDKFAAVKARNAALV